MRYFLLIQSIRLRKRRGANREMCWTRRSIWFVNNGDVLLFVSRDRGGGGARDSLSAKQWAI